jgi:hypothetical protein
MMKGSIVFKGIGGFIPVLMLVLAEPRPGLY